MAKIKPIVKPKKSKKNKKEKSDAKKTKKMQKHKSSKDNSKNNTVVSSSSETRDQKPSEIEFTWKMLSRATPDQIESIIFYIIQECQEYTFKKGYTPWPEINIEGEKRPLYKNSTNSQWEIPSDMFLKAAKSQRHGYLKQQKEKIEYQKYLESIRYQSKKPSAYDKDYHPRKLKKLVKKTPFVSHWAHKFEQTEATLEQWAKEHKAFGKIYYKHKKDNVRWFEKQLANLMNGVDKSDGHIKAADATKILQLMDKAKYSDKIDINQNTTITAYKDSTNEKKPSQKKVNKMDTSTIESIFNGSTVSSK